MTTSETWFDAIGRVGATVDGILHVHAGGSGEAGQTPGGLKVEPMIDDLAETPAMVLGYGGATITAGSWERQRHQVNASIWISRDAGIGPANSLAVQFVGRVLAAFPARARAFNVHPDLQSVLVTEFDEIRGAAWPPGSTRRFVVLPFSIEAVVNRAAEYQPQ